MQVTIDSIDSEFGGNIAVGLDVQKSVEGMQEALVPGFVGNDKGVFGCALQVAARGAGVMRWRVMVW